MKNSGQFPVFTIPVLHVLLMALLLLPAAVPAAKAQCANPLGDVNGDNIVDENDLAIFHDNWLVSPCDESNNFCDGADLDDSNNVDFYDYATFALDWLVVGNCPPDVNAGIDQTIEYPTLSVSLAGIVTDDGLPDPPAEVTTLWSVASGAAGVTFDDANAVGTIAHFPAAGGTFVLRLDANDGELSSYDEVTITVFGTPQWSETANYYVDGRTGDDSNPGSSSLPFKTISKATSLASTVNKKILVWGSQAYHEQIAFTLSGNSSNVITYKRDPASGEAVIDGTGLGGNQTIFSGRAYITVDGFTVKGSLQGVYIFGDAADNVTIRNCRITGNTRYGIYVSQGDNCTINNCAVYKNNTSGSSYANIYIYNGSIGNQITSCSIYGGGQGKYGIQVLTGDATVDLIRDCIITNHKMSGGIGINEGTAGIITAISYCDVWDNATNYSAGCPAPTNSISSDPMFIDPDNGNFRLGTESPCIGAGSGDIDMGYRYIDTAL